MTVCYIRDARDREFHIDRRARELNVDYAEVVERHSFDPGVWQQLRQIVAPRHVDLVHSHDYKTDLLAWLLWRRAGIVPLATAHGWTGHSARERYVYYPAHKRLLARFPKVIAVSSDIRRELIARGAHPDRVQVVLNGIDHRHFFRDHAAVADARRAFGVSPGEIAIGSVGRLEPQKRFDVLIRAFADLVRQQERLRLLIAGAGSREGSLKQLIDTHGLRGRCTLVGHLGDIRPFHHALDLFVQSSEYEGTPNVVLEAMALETPIVATDVGGTAEICRPGEDGLIVSPGDPAALKRAIDAALRDEDGRQARTVTARRRVEQDLSFDRRVQRVDEICTTLLRAVPA